MRRALIASALVGAMSLSGCGRGEAYDYPARHEAAFNRMCPASDPVCACIWDEITHELPVEDYEASMERFAREGLMHPKITRARTICRERHAS